MSDGCFVPAAVMAAGIFLSAVPVRAADLVVTVRNDLPIARRSETIEVTAAAIEAARGGGQNQTVDLARLHVFEQGSEREVLAQALDLDGNGTPESLLFQADLPPSGQRAFVLRPGEKRTYRRDDFKAYGRFVRERFDDFVWENDRTAHRMYGAALESWQREPLTSSAVDVWLKRTRRLVANDWYMTDDYHHDNGEGGDFYSAGRSRGCGGSGLWLDGQLVVSKNFRDSRVLANGPIRVVFELVYPVWESPGVRSETKRISLDAGQSFSRFESRYDLGGEDDITYAVGIRSDSAAKVRVEREAGWMRSWAPVKGAAGEFGCAVVVPGAPLADVKSGGGNELVIARAGRGASPVYWAGAGWDRSGDFGGVADFDRYIEEWVQRIRSPLHIEVK